jgi:hypothetical protein
MLTFDRLFSWQSPIRRWRAPQAHSFVERAIQIDGERQKKSIRPFTENFLDEYILLAST